VVTDNEGGPDSTVDYRTSQDGFEEPNPQADDKDIANPGSGGVVSDQSHMRDTVEAWYETGPPHRPDEGGESTGADPHETPQTPEGDPAERDPLPPEGGESPQGSSTPQEAEKEPKGKKKKKKAKERRKPTDKEIFSRLMEKNEIILQLNQKNATLEARCKALEDKRVRVLAEFENYRKRTRKEWELLKEQTKAEVILEILSVVDDFERALSATADTGDEFAQGIRLIYNNMLSTLERFGVRKMIAVGQPFDPNYHMAVAHIDSEEAESNHVVEVTQDGYLMDGTVIRPANVVIAK